MFHPASNSIFRLVPCRPDSSRWRSFSILSGGQQALATLALCFAVQVGRRLAGAIFLSV